MGRVRLRPRSYRDAPTPCRPCLLARGARSEVPPCVPVSLRRERDAATRRPGGWFTRSSLHRDSSEDDRASQVPGEPPCTRALLSDPVGSATPGPSRCHGCCLPPFSKRRLPNDSPFGALSHGPRTPCVRFATSVTLGHATLGSGCGPALPGRTAYLPGSIERFHHCYLIDPPLPGFAWRTKTSEL